MSINISVSVPLDIIEAVQSASTTQEKQTAAISTSSAQALAAAIDTLPYQITPKAIASAEAPQRIKHFNIGILTLTGKTIPLRVSTATTISELRRMIQDREGIPPDQMMLIWGGKTIGGTPGDDYDVVKERKTLGMYGISRGVTIHLVLTLRGS